MLKLNDCFKTYTTDQDKAVSPADTVARVKAVLKEKGEGVLAGLRRIDTGRLGIPVFISEYGPVARQYTPSHKQMGKGASPEQAEASALMELVERYSFFTFFDNDGNFEELTWSEAEKRYGDELMPVGEILQAVGDTIDEDAAREVLNLLPWRFCKSLHLASGKMRYVPVSLFKLLNEFNGSSAGNSLEESVLQGSCELVERHVSAVIDEKRPTLPTIDPESTDHPVIKRLVNCFAKNGVRVWLKDFSLDMPVPTVGALAYDPTTFPALSEIVVTAGTASSPINAAIRALTEVAQLAGDFETGARYEPSGMSKPASIEDAQWLTEGPTVAFSDLPDISRDNIREEIEILAESLQGLGYSLYTIDTANPALKLPTNYNFAPGFNFLERSKQASLGLFTGRRLAEETDPETATRGLQKLGEIYPDAHFLPFFEGMVALQAGDPTLAALKFEKALPAQIEDEDYALCAFYGAYALSQTGDYAQAVPFLNTAIEKGPGVKEYYNLRGVCLFKQHNYRGAADDFRSALDLDKSSAMDLANLGLCHKFLNEPEPAIEYLSEALRIDPSLEFARAQLAELVPQN